MNAHLRLRFLFVLLFFWLGSSVAAEGPIEGQYRHAGWCAENVGSGIKDFDQWTPCKKNPVNSLRIFKFEGDEYAVAIEFTDFKSTVSYCTFSGLFRRSDDTLSLVDAYSPMACKLKIRIASDAFTLVDPDHSCKPDFCTGRNAGFDDVMFPRWNDPKRSPYAKQR